MSKKALVVGVNYLGTNDELSGCINDAYRLIDLLSIHGGYPKDSIRLLADDTPKLSGSLSEIQRQFQSAPLTKPTRQAILDGIAWLMSGAKAGDQLFFSFSGHGTQVRDLNGDESDGKDEALCPVDYATAGFLIDDDLRRLLVEPLPFGCSLRIIADMCHSGSGLDLPWTFQGPLYQAGTKRNLWQLTGKTLSVGPKGEQRDVLFLSGCLDQQTSADAYLAGQYTGALTNAFCESLTNWFRVHKGMPKVSKLLSLIRQSLKPTTVTANSQRFTQIPQLSCATNQRDLDQMTWSF